MLSYPASQHSVARITADRSTRGVGGRGGTRGSAYGTWGEIKRKMAEGGDADKGGKDMDDGWG